jgi:hypothetical protein
MSLAVVGGPLRLFETFGTVCLLAQVVVGCRRITLVARPRCSDDLQALHCWVAVGLRARSIFGVCDATSKLGVRGKLTYSPVR